MTFIQWKQIDNELRDEGILTGSLRLTGSFFLNDINVVQEIQQSGIFKQTGSFWSATSDIFITGSLKLELPNDQSTFSINKDGESKFTVNTSGVVTLKKITENISATSGSLIYSGSDFYAGV